MIDEEDDERLREEAARWNKKAAALVRPVTTYWTRLGEVQAKVREARKSAVPPSVDALAEKNGLLAEKQKLQEKYNTYLSFKNTSEDLARAYAQILYQRQLVRQGWASLEAAYLTRFDQLPPEPECLQGWTPPLAREAASPSLPLALEAASPSLPTHPPLALEAASPTTLLTSPPRSPPP